MKRIITLAALAFCFAAPAHAAIRLEASLTPLDHGLNSWTIRAVSTQGEIINGVHNPSLISFFGEGVHQVWMPLLGQTPTQGDHHPIAFNPAWRQYDSFWFFAPNNSLSIGGEFTETNNETGGITGLPPSAAGEARTGFGTMGFSGASASKGFTIASGLQGTSVPLAQLVQKSSDFSISLGVLDNSGGNTRIDNFMITCHCGPSIFDSNLGDIFRGEVVMATLSTHPLDTIDAGSWTLDSFTGPDGGPVVGATVDPNTGKFSWNSVLQPLGAYSAEIGATVFGSARSGTLTFNLVPEPQTFALAAVTIVAFMVRRAR
jgi:hypothetical protein